jgi:long-chain acyl-CoA synthetase
MITEAVNGKTSEKSFDSLAALFLAQADRYRDKVLYRFSQAGQWHSLTWTEALIQVREMAQGLISLGVGRGDRVVIFSSNRVEWHLADWADICIGALSVPIYASSSRSQAAQIIGHADPVVILVDSLQRLANLDFSRLTLGQLKAIVVLEDDDAKLSSLATNILSLEALRQMGRSYQKRHAGVFESIAQSLRPEDDLTIIYTSGTTGAPKGVLTTHAHYLFTIKAVDKAIPTNDQDVTMHFLPTSHSLGRLEHFMAVAKGWTAGIARSIETIMSDLQVIRPTVMFSVPRIYENAHSRIRLRLGRQLAWRRRIFYWGLSLGKERIEAQAHGVAVGWSRSLAFHIVDRMVFARVRASFGGRLRLAICGGAPLSPDIAAFFRALGIVLLEGYGLTETSTVSHVNRPGRVKLGTVGLPLEGTDCRIAEDGEILLRGPNIFKSYFRDLMATEDAIDLEGWFHSGDVGMIDEAGFLRVTDRKKDLIVTSGGKKIAPQKLENLLKADPLIQQALIVGHGQPHLTALVSLDRKQVFELAEQSGVKLDRENFLSHPWVQGQVREILLRTNNALAPYEAIRSFHILERDFTVEDEELTPTLKPRRHIIAQRYRYLIEDLYRAAS